jgi:hypothetical protein
MQESHAEVEDLEAAGLSRPTGVRLRRVCVDLADVVDVVGNLSDADQSRILRKDGRRRAASSAEHSDQRASAPAAISAA